VQILTFLAIKIYNFLSQVRTIAKKYKLQFDQMVAESKDKESSDEKAKQLETTLAESQTQLAEAQTKLMDTEAEVQRLQQSVSEGNKQVISPFISMFRL
jgi:septal ring factor EnvC (AmiA/AmiB activator)